MKKLLIIITLSLLALDAFAQRRVSGYVVDEWNEVLIGARITEVSTENSTITNFDGRFELVTAKNTADLKISFVGMFCEIIKITSDTIVTIALEADTTTFGELVWVGQPARISTTIGVNTDITNSLYGVSFAQTFRGKFSYGVFAQTNFNNDYTFAGSVGVMHPFWPHIRRVSRLSLHYTHKNLSENIDFNLNKINLQVYTFFWSSGLGLFAEPTFQSLNNKSNFGLSMGLDRSFLLWNDWVRSVLVGFSAGYFSDYWTYSAGAHFHISRNFGLRFIYNRIDNYDFFNVLISIIKCNFK